MHEDEEMLTAKEAAEYLQVHVHSIYRLAKVGKIPSKIVLNKRRFEKEALRQWIADGGKVSLLG